MNERYIKWYTPWLSGECEILVFGNGRGLPLILFPTSFGRYYQNKDFGLVGSVAWFIDNGKITIYCQDAIDLESFYNKSISSSRQNADSQCVRKCDRARCVRSCPAGVQLSPRGSLRRQPRCLSRCEHRVSSSGYRQPPHQSERLVRYQIIF
jgi:hypothetical protein